MGKRELLLVVGFIVLGAVLYQATAPPAAEGGGFSLREMFRTAQRELSDNPATRDVRRTATIVAGPDAEVMRVDDLVGRIDVVGVDGDEVRLTSDVTLRGLDEADLDRAEQELGITLSADGPAVDLDLRIAHTGRRPDHTLRLELPRRLRLELGGRGIADIRGIAGLELDEFRGDVTVEALTGPARGSHREGRIEFGPGAKVDLETSRGTLRLVRPAESTLRVEATDVEVMDAEGPVTIDQERSTLEVIGGSAPMTVKGEGGTIKLRNIVSPVEIDAERLTVSLIMREPAPVTLTIEADDVDVTLPSGGVDLEARVERGELRVPTTMTTTTDGDTQQATASLDGGGPKVALTVVRGTLTVRKP